MCVILIVEDDDASRDMLDRRVQRWGYRTLLAQNGLEVLPLITDTRPDLILMDIGLPGMNGLEVTQQIKSSPEFQSIPVIALTAYSYEDSRTMCLDAGCDDFDNKPMNFTSLLEKIERLISTS